MPTGETLAVRTSTKISEDTSPTEPTASSNETHSHKYLRQESNVFKRNRVESFDTKEDCDFYGNSKTGRRAALTDSGVYNHRSRTPLHASQSLDNQSEDYSDGDAHKIDESHKKFQTLPGPFRSKKASGDCQPDILHGQLYKTSRGKITSNVTRGQHEPRQRRLFQLTEHSLEYSQTLQRVCEIVNNSYLLVNLLIASYRFALI